MTHVGVGRIARLRPCVAPDVGHRPALQWVISLMTHVGRRVALRTEFGVVLHLGGSDALRVAAGHLDDLGADLDELSARLELCSPAPLAHAEEHLVARASRISWTAEHVACHEQQCRIVVERRARVPTKLGHGLAYRGQRFSVHLESEHVPQGLGASRVPRPIAGSSAGDLPFELA